MVYYLYKLLGAFSEPMNMFAVALLVAALLAFFAHEKWQKVGRFFTLTLVFYLALLMVVPLGQWLVLPLENRYQRTYPKNVDGIVMLTGSENAMLSLARGKVPSLGRTGHRHLSLASLAKKYPKARLIVVGDPTPHNPSKTYNTQILMQDVLRTMNVDLHRVTFETKSRTTHENATYTKKLVNPKRGETWLLVTSAVHMQRSLLCFEHEGWKLIPFPSDYMTYPKPELFHAPELQNQIFLIHETAHEYVGLLSYWLLGWIERPWR